MTKVYGNSGVPQWAAWWVAAAAASAGPAWSQAVPAPVNPTFLTPGQVNAPEPAPELPAFLDDRRLQELEERARPRIEANEQRRAEKLKRKAIEADVKRKADEMRRTIDGEAEAAVAAPPSTNISDIIKPSQAVAAPVIPTPGGSAGSPAMLKAGAATALIPQRLPRPCTPSQPPTISTTPLAGGRLTLEVTAPCRAGEAVTVSYAPYVFVRGLDGAGRLSFVLDLFQGRDAPLAVVFKDGERLPVAIGETDIDRVSKIAVVWGKPVNIDVHVYEYAASPGAPGHIWPRNPSSAEAALAETERTKRGRGFLSFTSEGVLPGHQIEVYTVWHHPEQSSGVVSTALDFETRGEALAGETCGEGPLAAIPFETVALRPRAPVVRERGVIAAARCGANLLDKGRYMDEALADLSLVAN